ncbi:hypothetical protein SCYAM73S_05741 [Streptomyces cyaneofuscatus]
MPLGGVPSPRRSGPRRRFPGRPSPSRSPGACLPAHGGPGPAALQGEVHRRRVRGGHGRGGPLLPGPWRWRWPSGAGAARPGRRRGHGRGRGEPVHRLRGGVREVRERGGLHAVCLHVVPGRCGSWSPGKGWVRPRGVASIVPHLTRRGNGGVYAGFTAGARARGQREGAAAQFPGGLRELRAAPVRCGGSAAVGGGASRGSGCRSVVVLAVGALGGRRRRSGGSTPSASRRAVTRKPVWPIIRWSARGARLGDPAGYSSLEVPRCCPDQEEQASWRWKGNAFVRTSGDLARSV